MKIFLKPFLRLIFMAAVIACIGICTQSNASIHASCNDFSEGSTAPVSILVLEMDSIYHDQIQSKFAFGANGETVCFTQFLNNPDLISGFLPSIWQPPKC